MFYRLDCYIPVEPDEPDIFKNLHEANIEYDQMCEMHPENHYEVVECDKPNKNE